MGLFDNIGGALFGDYAGDAAKKQQAGIAAGTNLATGNLGQGLDQSIASLRAGQDYATPLFGAAGMYGAGGYRAGMGAGTNALTGGGGYAGGLAPATGSYSQALAPFTKELSSYDSGMQQYLNAIGANGQAGSQQALSDFSGSPGFQYTLNNALSDVDRRQAAGGSLGSGGREMELLKQAKGLTSQDWQQHVNNLAAIPGLFNQAATGAAGVLGNQATAELGTGQNIASLLNTGNIGAGGALAGAAQLQGQTGLDTNKTIAANQLGTGGALANLNYQGQTSSANAAANADLLKQQTGLGGLMGIAGLATGAFGGGLGGAAGAGAGAGAGTNYANAGKNFGQFVGGIGSGLFPQAAEGGHFRGGPIMVGEAGREWWFPDKMPRYEDGGHVPGYLPPDAVGPVTRPLSPTEQLMRFAGPQNGAGAPNNVGVPGYADGGRFPPYDAPDDMATPQVIGDGGPEIIWPDRSGTIIPNHALPPEAYKPDMAYGRRLWRQPPQSSLYESDPAASEAYAERIRPFGEAAFGMTPVGRAVYAGEALNTLAPIVARSVTPPARALMDFLRPGAAEAAPKLTREQQRDIELERQRAAIARETAAATAKAQAEAATAGTRAQTDAARQQRLDELAAEEARRQNEASFASQQRREEAARKANEAAEYARLPFAKKFTDLAEALPAAGGLMAAALPYTKRIGNALSFNQEMRPFTGGIARGRAAMKPGAEAGERIASSSELGDLRTLARKGPMPVEAAADPRFAKAGAGLAVESAMVPYEYNAAMLPSDSPDKWPSPADAATRAVMTGVGAGSMASLGHYAPVPMRRAIFSPSEAKGMMEAMKPVKPAKPPPAQTSNESPPKPRKPRKPKTSNEAGER